MELGQNKVEDGGEKKKEKNRKEEKDRDVKKITNKGARSLVYTNSFHN